MNIPNIDLKFDSFCNGCNRAKIKVIDGDRFYSDNGAEIYLYPPTVTCEHIYTCRALYERICKKEENTAAKNEAMKAAAAEFGEGLIRRRNEKKEGRQ